MKKLYKDYKLRRLLKKLLPKQSKPPALYTNIKLINKIMLRYWLTKCNLHAKYHVKSWLKPKYQEQYDTKIEWYLEALGY